jgi:hypothetical protein
MFGRRKRKWKVEPKKWYGEAPQVKPAGDSA